MLANLVTAQRQGDIQSMTWLLKLMTPLSQLDSGIMDYAGSDGISKHLTKILGGPWPLRCAESEMWRS